MCDDVIYSFPNFNGATIEFKWWINDFIRYLIIDDYSSMLGLKLNNVSKMGPRGFKVKPNSNDYNRQSAVISNHLTSHDDVIKWKHFPRYWPFVRGIHRLPVHSPHIGQWRGASMFPLIYAWINVWANNREAGDLRHHRAHYDVTLICISSLKNYIWCSYDCVCEVFCSTMCKRHLYLVHLV